MFTAHRSQRAITVRGSVKSQPLCRFLRVPTVWVSGEFAAPGDGIFHVVTDSGLMAPPELQRNLYP